MKTRAVLWAGVLIDVVLGLTWLFVPGLWQERVHPWAMGLEFSALQAAGAGRLARAAMGIAVARGCAGKAAKAGGEVAHASATLGGAPAVAVLRSRWFWAAALAGAWLLDLPAELLSAWRVGDAGPLARGVHMAAAAWAVVMVSAAARSASANRRSEVP